jgi:hypothetical protein
MDNLAKQSDFADNPVVLIVTSEFNAQHFLLLLQREVTIAPKPHPQSFQKPPQTLFPRLALDHPLAPARLDPVVGKIRENRMYLTQW